VLGRFAAVICLCGAASLARAQPDDDPFGIKRKRQAPVTDCSDGRALGCAGSSDELDATSPYALRDWLDVAFLRALPTGDARVEDVADFATGAYRDGAGVAFGGATGLETAWTLEGAPIERARDGAVETRVPLAFTRGFTATAGGFAARDRVGLGGRVDIELVRGGAAHRLDATAHGGFTEEPRRRGPARGSYQLRRLELATGPDASLDVVATGPLGGTAWYAAGIAPRLVRRDARWLAAATVDADADGVPDGLPGDVVLSPIETTTAAPLDWELPVLARAGLARGRHTLELTALATFAHRTAYDDNATLQAAGVARDDRVVDAILTYGARWSNTRLAARLSLHHAASDARSADPAGARLPQLLSSYVPAALPDDPVLAAACSTGACPIPFGFFASGGAGLLVDTTTTRPAAAVDLAHAAGRHVVRAVLAADETTLTTASSFTGGALVRSILTNHTETQRFFDGRCDPEPGAPCNVVDTSTLRYRTLYGAAYVEETFRPTANLQVNGGLRWELMWVGSDLHFSRELAPRLGVVYDFIDPGSRAARTFTSRTWIGYGRTHALLPAGLGVHVIGRDHAVRDLAFEEVADRFFDAAAPTPIASGLEPASQDEVTGGIELGVRDAIGLRAWIQHRSLHRGLDTMLTIPASGEVTFDNPGRPRDAALALPSSVARRETTLAAAAVTVAPSPRTALRLTYAYGQTRGNWLGPFDGASATLYANPEWNSTDANLDGRLPTDLGHLAAFDLHHRGHLGGVAVSAAGRFTIASGLPRDVTGLTTLGLVEILPRGSAGREVLRTRADLRLTARFHDTDVFLDAFDVGDLTPAIRTSSLYADDVAPIVDGSVEDLVFAKRVTCALDQCAAAPARRRTAFRLPVAFANPRAFSLGVRRRF
jgi:hypothetical protein